MSLKVKSGLISLLLTAIGIYSSEAAITKDFYVSSSILSTGKWVKVGVDKTGVYEISYEMLGEMGFTDPSKVAVYGRGGRTLPESFVSNSGIPIITDDLSAVKVLHEDNKLYFYGLGPEEINFTIDPEYETGGYFERVGNNIYTKRGYYFLTDSRDVSKMLEKDYDTSNAKTVEQGVSFIYHELDSVQNSTQTGQLFWGELIAPPGFTLHTWDVDMPDGIGGTGVMECVTYFHPNNGWNFGGNPKVKYGFEGDGLKISSTPYKENTSLNIAPHEPTKAEIDVPGNKGTVFVEFEGANDMDEYSNLDYWVVSYPSAIPTLETAGQHLIALPSIEKNATARIDLSDPAFFIVLDVTSPTDPQKLKIDIKDRIGSIGVKNISKPPVLVVFDKDKPQLQISGYETNYTRIDNQNLHGYKDKGADFIIVTTRKFRRYAEEIAELHREHDGIEVVVASVEELYNEFSGGTPDPMAYRSFAKMLYLSDRKPKNMLLFGPLCGDARGLLTEHDPSEIIIAYQSPQVSVTRGAHNINDFYGMMSDKFRADYYERNEVQIGVGILPVKFESDAQIIVDKIRNYLERDDHAYYLNKYTAIGGLGDSHTHDIQVRDINSHVRILDNQGTIFTPLSIDTYGNAEARKKFLNQINDGCSMFSYFGHGAEQFLGKDKYFFNAGDVYSLRNKILPFALFGGCQITNTDRGFRGLGETIVTSTPYGCIGSIVSARDTWSGQNYEFFKQFFTCLYTQGSTTAAERRDNPVTIGEVYASVKNYSTYSNELAYQLLCDPAIVIPIINRKVRLSLSGEKLKPGDPITIGGNILAADGDKIDVGFNGKVVVRLNQPVKEVGVGMIETKEDPGNLAYQYRDEQVSMAVAEVKNGEFALSLHVPSSMVNFLNKDGLIYVAAYDPSTRLGAGGEFYATIGDLNVETTESTDNTAPVIEAFGFENADCSLSFTVSDDVALNMSSNPLNKGLYLYIDGKERSEAHFVEPDIETGRVAFSKNVFIDGLSFGEHSARLKVKDAKGNVAEQEIKFTYTPPKARYIISKDNNSSAVSTVINIDGELPPQSMLVVISAAGTEVWRGEVKGNNIEWDHKDQNGNKVAPGHYKAYLIETGEGSLKGHSEAIDLPVI